jgi:small-conductance mechanosensitive channel/CRP-like cAMP-binding protein
MPSNNFRKKLLTSLGLIVLITAVLVLFPSDKTLNSYMADSFGMVIDINDAVVSPTGDKLPMMVETTVSLVRNIANIVEIILWMALVITAVRLIFFAVARTLYRGSTHGEVSSLLKTVLSVIIYIVAFFIIFQSQYPDVQLAPLFTGSTIIGIVVGLALQDTLGNLFAGLALQADQPFQIGDVVMIPGRGEGVVEFISWRGVQIRTFNQRLLVISNSVLGKEIIEVAPKNNLNAKAVFFNTLYTHSPTKTIQLVREAVRQVDNVSPKMRPVVRIRNLGDNGIDMEVKYWLEDYTLQHDTDALIRQRIWYLFQREGIDFAYPTRTLHIEQKQGEKPQEEFVNNVAEQLNRVSIFNPLSDEEIEKLANATTSRVYAPGEAIVRMGQEANSMFVILSGSVKVEIPDGDSQRVVGMLAENDFFGEMSLLTGEPRSANVIAIVETEVLRIDKNALYPIFAANPTVVETISEMIEERRQLLQSKSENEEEEESSSPKKSALRSIRKFFGLKK